MPSVPRPPMPPPPPLGFAKIRRVWRGGGRERKRENGLKGLNHWPAKLKEERLMSLTGERPTQNVDTWWPTTNRGGARGPGSAEFVGEKWGEPDGREAGGKLGRQIPPPLGGDLVFQRVSFRLQTTGRSQHLARRRLRGRNLMIKREGDSCPGVQLVRL